MLTVSHYSMLIRKRVTGVVVSHYSVLIRKQVIDVDSFIAAY